jgi:hypothetical protein
LSSFSIDKLGEDFYNQCVPKRFGEVVVFQYPAGKFFLRAQFFFLTGFQNVSENSLLPVFRELPAYHYSFLAFQQVKGVNEWQALPVLPGRAR